MNETNTIIGKNEYRKWICQTFAILLTAMIVTAGLVIWIDPFFHYHKPIEGFPYQIDHQLSQNPGMAKHFDYDSVLLGSSMTANFDASWFEELYGEHVLKLCYNGAYPRDNKNIMAKVDESGNTLKHVYWGIDVSSLSALPYETKYPIPEYMYNNNPFDDVKYLYNKDVLMDYIVKPVLNHDEPTDLNTVYSSEWWMQELYGKDYVLSNYVIPEKNDASFPDYMFLDGLRQNLDENILPIIESHPDTKFTFFFPPVNVLYWYEYLQNNQMDAVLAEYNEFAKEVLAYDNVELFCFTTDEGVVTNLDLYVDLMHHKESVDRYLTESFAERTHKMELNNYKTEINILHEIVLNYDYEGLLSEKPTE